MRTHKHIRPTIAGMLLFLISERRFSKSPYKLVTHNLSVPSAMVHHVGNDNREPAEHTWS